MDLKITSAFISAAVALLVAILNHFIITPCKEKRERKRQQLKILYYPLYSLVSARLDLVKANIVIKGEYLLGSRSDSKYYSKEYMETFFLERSGYASDKLIKAWVKYSSAVVPDHKRTKEFILQLVKDYNQIKKDLKMDYNKDELETGFPEILEGVKIRD